MPEFHSHNATFHHEELGRADAPFHIVWGHGWGTSGHDFRSVAQSLAGYARHTLLDFPGFGASPPPPAAWSTQDYADAVAEWIGTLDGPVIWAGHSFGGRVGLRLASKYPQLLRGMFIIAGAGLKRKRPWPLRARIWITIRVYKILKRLLTSEAGVAWLKARFGSADYRNAGIMRPILVLTVNEDQTENARAITCPTRLVYGEKDTETPPEIGQRLATLIPGAQLTVLPGLDHYSILTTGQNQLTFLLHQFMESLR